MKSDPQDLPQEPCTTIDLVVRAQKGEDHVLSELFLRCSPQLRRFVRRKIGARLRGRIESMDIVQNVIAQATVGIETFEPRGDRSWINYLCKIAENKIKEEIRYHWAKRRSPDREVPLEDQYLSTAPRNDETPSQVYARSDVSVTVRDSIDALREDCQQSIILRCFCDASYAEIAELTNRPTSHAARMFHRDTAIKGLAEQLRMRGVTAVDLQL